MSPDGVIAHLAAVQHGAVSRTQAHDAGLSDKQLAARVGDGVLVKVGANAFRFPYAPTGPLAELSALVLDVGAPVWVSGWTAAAMYGFDGFPLRPPYDLLIPSDRCVRRPGVRVHRSDDTGAIDVGTRSGLPITTAERTVIDIARRAGRRYLLAAVDSGIRDRVLDEDRLHRRIVALRSQGKHGIPRLLDVLERREMARGGESWLERRFLELLLDECLPQPLTQQVLDEVNGRQVRVDCRFPGTNVVVEVLGYAWHRTVLQMNRDAERMNALIAKGFHPYQFTYDQIVRDPASVARTVRAALMQARAA